MIAVLAGRLVVLDRAVHDAVVGQPERGLAEVGGALGERLDLARAVEQRVLGVDVQMGAGGGSRAGDNRRAAAERRLEARRQPPSRRLRARRRRPRAVRPRTRSGTWRALGARGRRRAAATATRGSPRLPRARRSRRGATAAICSRDGARTSACPARRRSRASCISCLRGYPPPRRLPRRVRRASTDEPTRGLSRSRCSRAAGRPCATAATTAR